MEFVLSRCDECDQIVSFERVTRAEADEKTRQHKLYNHPTAEHIASSRATLRNCLSEFDNAVDAVTRDFLLTNIIETAMLLRRQYAELDV